MAKKKFDTSSKEYKNSSERSKRIAKIRAFFFKGRYEEFAKKLQVSVTYASGICNSKEVITEKTLEKILNAFPDVSRQWLYLGEGEMLCSSPVLASEPRANLERSYSEGTTNTAGDVSGINVQGRNVTIPSPRNEERYDRLISLLEKQHDERTRLLSIIENLTSKN